MVSEERTDFDVKFVENNLKVTYTVIYFNNFSVCIVFIRIIT